MEDSFNKVIDLLFLAKQNGIQVVLNEERLQLKIAEDKNIDENILTEIRKNKQLIIDYLTGDTWNAKTINKNYNKINRFSRDSIGYIPLSFSQERLWFIDQKEGSVQYHLPVVLRLKGDLSKDALLQSLHTIIERHDVLRTVYEEHGGQVYQSVIEGRHWQLQLIRGASYERDGDALAAYIEKLIEEPFDLSKHYPVRGSLISLGEREHVLVIIMHHIASDAWSQSILVSEVVELYNALLQGRQARLPAVELQYADYAVWQRSYLQGELLDKKLSYWKDKLTGLSALQLPTDYTRPLSRSNRGASFDFKIDSQLSGQLQELCRHQGTTLFMTLLAVYKVMLNRYSGQEDISVGTSIASRQQRELEGLVGFFVNTLALRDQVQSHASFTELLQQVKATTLQAYEHQDVPFEKVVETVVREREGGRNPLFQVMLVVQNTPQSTGLALGEVELSVEAFNTNISKFDITFFVAETADGLQGSVHYSTELYDEGTISRMTAHFVRLLCSVVKDAQQQVGLLSMLTPLEEEQILHSFNDSRVDYPRDKSVVALFEEQVVRTPHHRALVFEDQWLTYGQLNEKANQLAHYLRSRGVQPDSLVPVYADRSTAMVIAMLGILKAGAAYVPIDSDLPADRIAYMLSDTGAWLLVSGTGARMHPEVEALAEVVRADAMGGQPTGNVAVKPLAGHLAYVIYTSGSTGRPKGVMIEHRSLVDYYYGLSKHICIDQCRSFALVSTMATDLGNTVIYGSLLSGGALHVFSRQSVSDAGYLQRYFREHGIDCVKIVPSHWKALSAGEQGLLLPEKLLIFGGEALQREVAEEIRSSGSVCRVVNHYGPTETTIGKLLHEVKAQYSYDKTVPVGRPFSNTQVYVLSKQLQLCPVGIPGQLYIGGEGLARGYYNNEGLTAEKFIADPFDREGVLRMYGTGDQVKWQQDGNIMFIGRVDDQVKIRGYRVEPGEVERVLEGSELVSQAVVVAREDKQGDKRLVAYIVSRGAMDREGVLAYVKEKLPEYMVPSVLMEVESIPLTANGKADRKALAEMEGEGMVKEVQVAPVSELQAKLASIWQEVLEVEEVGVEDDFFELGGHSLLAVRLISAIRKAFRVEMPIGDIFDYPTVSLLSERLGGPGQGAVLAPQVKRVDPRPDHLPLSFSQERLWFIDQLDGSAQYHVPSVLRLKGVVDQVALGNALQQIIERHEVLRTVIVEQEGRGYQVVRGSEGWRMQTTDGQIYRQDAAGLHRYIKRRTEELFDLSQDYMVRAELIGLQEDDHVLVVTLHHIVSDGYSTSIMVRELMELYNAAVEGRVASLQVLAVQYADYAMWQRAHALGEEWESKLGYWKAKLEGVSVLQLPTDHPRPVMQSTRGAIERLSIDRQLSEGLRSIGRQQGATLFMTLVSAFQVLLYRYSGQQDICIGTPVAGRQHQELEGLIGLFVNTLAVRSEVEGSGSFRELLGQVKATTLEAYANQEVPFERVVELVVKERDMSRSPLFQVMFVLQNTPDIQQLQLGNVQLFPETFDHSVSAFDLTLSVKETTHGLDATLEYCSDLYERQTIIRMIGHFIQLLKSIVQEPEKSIEEFSMLTVLEQSQLLNEFNVTQVNYSDNKSIVDLFEEQVLKTRDSIAVVYEEEQLSYGDLNEQSNQLAHYLRSRGVKEETLVPICIERSVGMIVGILGILKAGGAYVPVDPAYPQERINYILQDTGATVVVCSIKVRSKIKSIKGVEYIESDKKSPDINQLPVENLRTVISPHNLAYLIYTSGSTGKPKGVLVEHCSLINITLSWRDHYHFDRIKPVLFSVSSIAFDVFTGDWCRTLTNGGKMIIANSNNLDMAEFYAIMQKHGVNILESTPALVDNLIKYIDDGQRDFSFMRLLIIGSDILNASNYSDLLKHYGQQMRIINSYGVTEATIDSSYFEGKVKKNGITPIGKPLSNIQLYILSNGEALCPIGVIGEICIGGAGLARGYLNMPELTAAKFLTDPFSKEKGSRLYRTGDLGRWLVDGNIEFLGRMDNQVKVRGYRIELGEIESVLQQSGMVKGAVVLARENSQGTRRLTGYVVAGDGYTKEGVTAFLHSRLPEYMVPALWVELDELPLTSNGKVDRKSLPDADETKLSTKEYAAPRNELEKHLAGSWQQLLNIQRVGIYDNFFEVGGDSILSIQVVSRMRRLGYEIHPRDIFVHQTIARLSAALSERSTSASTGEQGVLGGASGLLPIQQWYLDKDQAAVSHYNQSVLLSLDKSVTAAMVQQAFTQLLLQHDALRFSYSRAEGPWQQQYGAVKDVLFTEELPLVDDASLAMLIGQKADSWQRQLDIEKGELVRVVMMLTPAVQRYNRLLLVIHHLAIDGVSWRILLEDLEVLLSAISRQQPAAPGFKGSSYRQWYQALEQYGKSSRLLSQQPYWYNTIRSYEGLPVDKAYKGRVRAGDTGVHIVRLKGEHTRRLLQEVPRVYHTQINDMLLCALAVTLCEWAGRDKVVIGLEGHGREQIAEGIDTSRTLGWFTSLYPVLLETGSALGADGQIKSVKEQLRRVPDRGLGYGVLKYINRDTALQVEPVWDIVFNYLGQLDNVVKESVWLAGAPESAGTEISEGYETSEKMSVNSSVQSGELVLNWGYSRLHYESATIAGLAEAYVSKLEELIAHCLDQQDTGPVYTPSDYGLGAEISYGELDRFLNEPFEGSKRKDKLEGMYRLSGLQQGMLFHGLYDKEVSAYTEQLSCDLLHGQVDHLIKSWQQVLKNHSALRSVFYYDEFSIPVQCVYGQVRLPVEVLDYSEKSEAEQAEAVRQYQQADRSRGFDFTLAPLMRVSIIRLSAARYRMIWTSHHILFDGWSLPVLMEEFLRVYESLATGTVVREQQEDRYEDYIRYTERVDRQSEEKYWRGYMQGVEQSTLLPFIGSTPQRTKGAGRYRSLPLELDAVATARVQGYAQRHRLTVSTVMQGVWSLLLHRYTGNRDVVFGMIVSGRPDDLPDVENRVGMYINTLPMHSRVQGDQQVTGWLQELQGRQVSSLQYQYTALQDIQGWSAVGGDLFDSILVFENYPVSEVISSGKWSLGVEDVQVTEHTNYPLSVIISSAEKISVVLSYNADLLGGEYAQQIRGHFEHVLNQIAAADEESLLQEIEVLTEGEKHRLVEEFNDSRAAYPKDKTIVGLFEQQAERTPENIAVVYEGEQLSYRQLNERSNQLAHYLRSQGVKEETLVPVCMERSAEMIVAMVGILKAGGAYVPIDPQYPVERIGYMLEDTGAWVVVSDRSSSSRLAVLQKVQTIETDGDWLIESSKQVSNLSLPIDPGQLAYVIYTSGSTGTPKGVMIEHGNVVRLFITEPSIYDFNDRDVWSMFHSFCFDFSVWEMYGALFYGGRLVVVPREATKDVALFSELILREKVTVLNQTPSAFYALQEHITDKVTSVPIRYVIFGGEALNPGRLQPWKQLYSDCRLVNMYGITETTVHVTYQQIELDHIEDGRSIIGKPIPTLSSYVVDSDQKLVAIGVAGELCIGGAGVARGYLNRAELTAQRFIRDPFSTKGGARMYRTGDLGRWLPDGSLEYLGRMDDQVKIRGYRIELGEIEAVLLQSGLVKEAVILAKEDQEGIKRMIGYVVTGDVYSRQEMTAYLSSRLPEYMVPQLWVELDHLPMTSNGKADKKNLPDVDIDNLGTIKYLAPRNELEKHLAAIWQGLLGVKQIGIQDNFFELGGHSLLAMRLVSLIRKEMEVELSIKDLFSHSTISSLAWYLQQQNKGALLPSVEKADPRPDRIPLSFSQERLWFIDQLTGSTQYHVPAILRLKGSLDSQALLYAMQQIINRHEVLRTVFLEEDGQPYQWVKEKDNWQLQLVDGSVYEENTEGLQQYIHHCIDQRFNLAEDYMVRSALIRLREEDHILVVTLHHIASDGYSTSIMVSELMELYNARLEKRDASLLTLLIQYADYAVWQRRYMQGEVLNAKIQYWQNKLKAMTSLQLPTDYQRPLVQSREGAVANFTIRKELSDRLQLLSQQQNVTLFMTFLAAIKVLLYRYSGQQDICVGTAIAERQQQELEGLIGFFVNTLALRSKLTGTASFNDLLQQVKTTTLEAYEHNDVPFERVVESVEKERDMSRSPLFQVMLVLQNTPDVQVLRLGELLMTHEMAADTSVHNTSKFDLTFSISKTLQGFHISIEYSTALYHAQTIKRMAAHYSELLHSIVTNPHQSIGSLPMLGSQEAYQLLQEFNNTSADYPKNKTIADLFEEQVAKSPESVAITFEEEQVTYQQLNTKANKLAHYLRSQGVKKETFVPICVERSIDMIVGILGILKAGGAYVPIDPGYPLERISYILKDIDGCLVLSSTATRNILPANSSINNININDPALFSPEHSGNLQINIQSDNLAYIIYTSGSTGKPKGVMVTQNNVVSLVKGIDYVSLGCNDILLSTGSSSFDATTFEYWGMLLNGGQLILCTEDRLLDNELLKEEINKRSVNKMWFTSSWFNQLVEADLTLFEKLDTILVGGEKLSEHHIEKLRQSYPDITVINGYGPTENTTFSLTYSITATKITQPIPIGRPFSNRVALILDENEQLVPVGVSGEICLSGAGLSRGYLNQPELTAQKFVRNPFDQAGGSRLYRTGDLGRWLVDGNIEFLGRMDNQVKVRGYRIELGEIESVLQQSGMVKGAVVLARENSQGTRRLTGYVVAGDGYTKEGVTAFLHSRLPEYMVPALWVELDELPLTSNGKVDRKSLPDADETKLSTKEYAAPRNELEKHLAGSWQQLLNIQRVGIYDNFFEVGGDSILSIQVVSRMRRLGYEIHPRDIFVHQTIARLSAALSERSTSASTGEQGVLGGASGLLPIQQWYLDKDQAAVSHYNQSVLLSLDKSVTAAMVQQAFTQLLLQHDALRFSYSRAEGPWQQQYGAVKDVLFTEELPLVDDASLAMLIGQKADSWQRQLDIEKGELVRVVMMLTPAVQRYNRLLLVIHHLAIDGVSWRILLEDLEVLLSAISRQQPAAPGFKGSSYRQWYQALEQYGKSSRLLSQQPYWYNTIRSYEGLPVDKAYKGRVRAGDTGVHIVRLKGEHTRRLLQEVPRVYHTQINDMLLCALAVTLCEWAGRDKVVIGLEGHGREQIAEGIDTSRTLGWFTSLYPVLLETGSALGADGQIKSVKEQLRRVPDRGLGYGVLKYINRDTALQVEPVWDIVFNYLGQLDNVVKESVWLAGAPESAGTEISEGYETSEKMSVNSSVQSGELVLNWGYSRLHYESATIAGLAEAYVSKLEELIAHCLDQQDTGPVYTPSDYGLGAEISYGELDRFLNEPFEGSKRKDKLEGMYRLSGLQQGMLFHGLYDKEVSAYTEQLSCDLLHGQVDHLIKSWQQVLKNHSALRSVFYYDEFSIPVQCVYGQVRLPVEVLDYSEKSEAEQAEAVRQYQQADRSRGFDFTLAPLMRVSIIRLSAARYRMIWTSHHILFDGWSLPVLMEEFLRVYESLATGTVVREQQEDRYEDYIRYTERVDRQSEEKYWRGYMQGVEQSTLLPFIGSTPQRTKGAGRYRSLPLELDAVATARVQGYAQRHRLTVSTVMQGVWSLLLHRYTGNRDVVFGMIVSGRPDDLPDVENRVGMYINTLPMHSRVQGDQQVTGWLQELQGRQVSSLQYQYTALQDIQGWSAVGGDLFDSILVFENYPVSEVISSGKWSLGVEDVQVTEHTNYPLSVIISSAEKISVVLSYNADLLGGEYAQQIRGHFEHVLNQIAAADEESLLQEIEVLTEGEKHRLVEEFNDSRAAYPKDKTIVGLFEQQAERTPENIAVVYEGEQLSYRQLNERSNQLAHYLRSQGVKEETLVPVCMERSAEMIVAMVGILKAGGAYVPIDPQYPVERIGYMLEDTGAWVVVSDRSSSSRLAVLQKVQTIETDGDWLIESSKQVSNLSLPIDPGQLAYVIYTSGSTGTPKGVMIEHISLVNLVTWHNQAYDVLQSSRATAMAGISFDAFGWEIWPYLSCGAGIYVIDDNAKLDLPRLVELFIANEITHSFIATALVHDFIYESTGKKLVLQYLLTGGDKLQPVNVNGLSYRLVNNYGPTENTVVTTNYEIRAVKEWVTPPIGKPISNITVYLLNEQQQLVPIGVAGELCIGGSGLARGYLNRPDVTAEKFLINPFNTAPGERLYRSGDLCRWLPDGNIEYLDRIDDQVKIRGFRIELGEIETVLQQCGWVSKVVVLAKQDKESNHQLVAYVVPNGVFQKELLLGYLRSKLPEYMIPGLWVEMEYLPLTLNGKIDRKALPDPTAEELLSNQFIEPRNELEAKLADIWKEILSLERVGINDSFFDLGGHSLLVMKLITSIRRELKIDLAIKVVFELRTIEELADYIKLSQKDYQGRFEEYDTIQL